MSKKFVLGSTLVAVLAFAIVIAIASSAPKITSQTKVDLSARLAACGSIPNGSSTSVVETTRMFINLPKDIYPDIKLQITPHGATAGWISNAGPYGYAFGARGKPNCWSYYLEFDRAPGNQAKSGTVDIGSKSGISGIPNYLIHVKVVLHQIDVTAPAKGAIHGRVLLGPTCPVERIPPDPACAPKPYETAVQIFRAADTTKIFMTVQTDTAGVFDISLEPGAYVLRAESGSPYPRCTDTPIQVLAGKAQNVVVNCDTGIR